MEFTLVQNPVHKLRFRALWEDFCEERNIPNYEHNKAAMQYLLLNNSIPIGTIQFAPFILDNPQSEVEMWYPFSKNEKVKKLKEEEKIVYEISKLSIKKDRRGKGYFKELITMMGAIAREKDIDYCVAVVSERIFLYLISNRLPCERLEEKVMLTNKVAGIPIILHAKGCMEKLFIFPWYRDLLVELKNGH